jgi:hypothetical protein
MSSHLISGYYQNVLKKGIESFKPDFLFIADGWLLKPYIVNAFSEYKPLLRFYAYETLCLLEHRLLFQRKENKVCDNSILISPWKCIICKMRYEWDRFYST